MLTLAIVLNLVAAAGLFAMAAKYIRVTPPMDYHAEILSGVEITDRLQMVIGALYKTMGGAFVAIGVGIVVLTVFGVRHDVYWAKLSIFLMVLIAGGYAIVTTRAVEAATGVRTPWRIAVVLTGLGVLAFILSLL